MTFWLIVVALAIAAVILVQNAVKDIKGDDANNAPINGTHANSTDAPVIG